MLQMIIRLSRLFYSILPEVPKLLWICTRVKVEVINKKTTWVIVKSTGGKTYLSKKYKVS
jgi:hypothetical protein